MIEDGWRTFKNRLVAPCPRVPEESMVQPDARIIKKLDMNEKKVEAKANGK